MKSNKQQIILVDDTGELHQLNSVAEMNEFITNENKARSSKSVAPMKCENIQVFVGEKRCLQAVSGGATTQYQLSGSGCECGQSESINS